MIEKTRIINGVTVVDITPELTPEEDKERTREVAEGLLAFAQNRKKDKTA